MKSLYIYREKKNIFNPILKYGYIIFSIDKKKCKKIEHSCFIKLTIFMRKCLNSSGR